jgi:hypothetical protein
VDIRCGDGGLTENGTRGQTRGSSDARGVAGTGAGVSARTVSLPCAALGASACVVRRRFRAAYRGLFAINRTPRTLTSLFIPKISRFVDVIHSFASRFFFVATRVRQVDSNKWVFKRRSGLQILELILESIDVLISRINSRLTQGCVSNQKVGFSCTIDTDNSKFEESYSFSPRNEPDYTDKFTKLSAEKCSNEEIVPQTFK